MKQLFQKSWNFMTHISINAVCRPFYDDNNNLRLAVDLEMKGFIKEAIIRKILNFYIKRF